MKWQASIPHGQLANARKRWGGIMRGIDQTDFETANIEFIEFWVLDPFIKEYQPCGWFFILQPGKYF